MRPSQVDDPVISYGNTCQCLDWSSYQPNSTLYFCPTIWPRPSRGERMINRFPFRVPGELSCVCVAPTLWHLGICWLAWRLVYRPWLSECPFLWWTLHAWVHLICQPGAAPVSHVPWFKLTQTGPVPRLPIASLAILHFPSKWRECDYIL